MNDLLAAALTSLGNLFFDIFQFDVGLTQMLASNPKAFVLPIRASFV